MLWIYGQIRWRGYKDECKDKDSWINQEEWMDSIGMNEQLRMNG